MIGKSGGSDGVDETYAHRSMDGFGAFILGRNMFGSIRGPWPDENPLVHASGERLRVGIFKAAQSNILH